MASDFRASTRCVGRVSRGWLLLRSLVAWLELTLLQGVGPRFTLLARNVRNRDHHPPRVTQRNLALDSRAVNLRRKFTKFLSRISFTSQPTLLHL